MVAVLAAAPDPAFAAVVSAAAGVQSYDGDRIDHDWSGSGLVSLQFPLGESYFSLGPVVELYGVALPESGDVSVVSASVSLDLHPLGSSRSGLLDVAVGAHTGPVYGNGGLDAGLGAHGRVALRVTSQAEVFARAAFTLVGLPYGGECDAVSPVAGCGWTVRSLGAQVGLGWQLP